MTGFYDIEWDNCYQISLVQSYLSQLVINRWFYCCPEPYEGALSSIELAFEELWLPVLAEIQSTGLSYTNIIVTELFGDRQTLDTVLSAETGAVSGGEQLPAFFGSRFRLVPFNTRVRKGRKIFSGMRETVVQADDIAPTYVTPHANVALAMNDAIEAESQSLLPSLLSPANTKHAGNVITQINTASWTGWSTQSSRKIGRGQ
jgi:hypothetical protein